MEAVSSVVTASGVGEEGLVAVSSVVDASGVGGEGLEAVSSVVTASGIGGEGLKAVSSVVTASGVGEEGSVANGSIVNDCSRATPHRNPINSQVSRGDCHCSSGGDTHPLRWRACSVRGGGEH